jgi:hypothetical protein
VGYLLDPNDNARYLQPKADASGYEFNTKMYRYKNGARVPYPDTKNTHYDNTPWDVTSIACIMDGPFEGETEFSTPSGNGWVTDHALPFDKSFTWPIAPDGSVLNPPFTATATVLTEQNKYNNNESAWETIVRNFPSMQIPITVPQSAELTGFMEFDDDNDDDIEFLMMPAINELSTCIDRSGSMSGTPLALAKAAGILFTSLTHKQYDLTDPWDHATIHVAGDYLSVTSFGSASSLEYSDSGKVAEMTDSNKADAIAAIQAINPSGYTSIGSGLEESRNTFTDFDIPKTIVVLSDGQENTAPYISSVKQSLIDKDIRVFTVGLGAGADKNRLRQLANDTQGEFFYADNAFQLPGIFATIYGNLRDDGFLKVIGGILRAVIPAYAVEDTMSSIERHIISPMTRPTPKGHARLNIQDVSNHTETVTVNDTVGEVTFLATWDQGNGTLNLEDPNGTIITNQDFDQYQGASYNAGDGYAFYRIENVIFGDWHVSLEVDDSFDVQWELRVFSIDANIHFEASSNKGEYAYPEPAVITASCNAPQPVIGGKANAIVITPDGLEYAVDLYDNGDANHGDEYANDGIYSGIFTSFTVDGVYNVTATFDSTNGTTPDGSSIGIQVAIGDILVPEPVPVFNRFKQFTFTVSDVPDAALTLTPGWNLISLCKQPPDNIIPIPVDPISGKYSSLWSFQDNSWKVYDPDQPGFSDLSTMEAGWGYWINMTETGTLPVTGTEPSKSIDLIRGWNLVGYNSCTSQPITDALASIEGKYTSVWAYINGKWKFYDPADSGMSDLDTMEPWYGYWIKTNQNCTWTLP